MYYEDYLEHYGVKGMKWGKHKKFNSGSINPSNAHRRSISGPTSDKAWQMTAAARSGISYDKFKTMSEEEQLNAAIRTNTPTGSTNPEGSGKKLDINKIFNIQDRTKRQNSNPLNVQDRKKEPKKDKAARALQSKIKMNYTVKTIRSSAATKVGESVLSALKRARK